MLLSKGTTLFQSVNTELKKVRKLLLGFEDVLLDGERRRELGNKGAERWMNDLKDLFYDIDDLLDEIKMEKHQLDQENTGQPSNTQVRYDYYYGFLTLENIKKGLDQVLDILRELTEEANRLELKRDVTQHNAIWLESQAQVRRKPGCYADEAVIHGRKEEKKEIIEILLANDGAERRRNYEVVCVVGMGGLGKTTLAQLVFQDDSVNRSFSVRSWVCVSDVFNVTKVIQNLIENASENAGKNDGLANMPSELATLQARLTRIINGQKFLLVLDDVWTANVFEQLKGPLNFGAKGSKILITTRLSKVAVDLRNEKAYRLGPLEDAQCLTIFNDNAFGEEDGIDNDTNLVKMGEEIVRKCKGVPLVAKVIGAMLKGKDEGEWKAVKDDGIWGLAYEVEDLHPGLRLSYFYLPTFLKRCFEYFALFPTDFKFDQSELVRMWTAEGLIEGKEGREPEDIGNQYYNDLKGRSLIQENDMMHDMLHHLACTVSGRSFFRGFNGSSSSTSLPECVRHAFTQEEVLIDPNKLRTLIHKGKLGRELFSYKRLRVLEVRTSLSDLPSSLGCDWKHLRYLKLKDKFGSSTLPDSVCTLTNLQVLDLSLCMNLKNLSQNVGKLSNLRFLGLESTRINGLPDSICRLTNLQVLNLSYCRALNYLPQDIGKLLNLQFLRLQHSRITVLPDSVCTLLNLRVLDLYNCRNLKPLPKDIGNLRSLHELILKHSSISRLPESIVNATNLRVLEIRNSDTLPAHIGMLTKLEELRNFCVGKEKGRGIDELKDMNMIKGSLKISNMENIESAEEALRANLRNKKHIENLEFLWRYPDIALTGRDGEMEVRVLEALEPNAAIKYLSLENYVGHKFPSWMSTAPLHNLTSLYLINLRLTTELAGVEFKSLLVLDIYDCLALREVSTTTPKLETLIVANCKELIVLNLPPCLRVLNIKDCPNLRNLPYGLHDLTSLQKIAFLNCPSLEIRPYDPLPSSIKSKSIYNCPKLDVQRVMEKEEEWKGAFGLI